MHKLRIYISYKILIFLKDFIFIQRIGNGLEEGMPQWMECFSDEEEPLQNAPYYNQ